MDSARTPIQRVFGGEGLPSFIRRREAAAWRSCTTTLPASWRIFGWLPGFAAALIAGAALWFVRPLYPLTAAAGVSSASMLGGGWVSAPEFESLPLRLSDGTRIDLLPRAQLRMHERGREATTLVLESGQLDVDVASAAHRRWDLQVGPFHAEVSGASFGVNWQPADDLFEVDVARGQIWVDGCGLGEGRMLASGQSLRASCGGGSGSSRVSTSSAPIGSTTLSAASDWHRLAREGKYVEALEAAESRGFSDECARADASALLLLGEAARRAHEPTLSYVAWIVLRQRFAGTPEAALAAFSLGLLAIDVWNANAEAKDWFRTYAAEDPKGTTIAEMRRRLLREPLTSAGDEPKTRSGVSAGDDSLGP